MRKRLVLLLKFLISLAFLAFLFMSVDPEKLKSEFSDIDFRFAAAGVLLSFIMVGASTWKWWLLLRIQNSPVRFPDLYRWYFVGYFYSNFLPSNVGGDVARAVLATKKAASSSAVLISIFSERFSGLLFLLLLAVMSPWLKPGLYENPAVAGGSAVAAGLLFFFILLMMFGNRVSRFPPVKAGRDLGRKLFRADRPGRTQKLWDASAAKLMHLSEKLSELGGILLRNPLALLQVFLLTALYYILAVVNVLLAFRAFGVWADPAGIAAVLPVALMVAMIPVSLGSWGIAEGSYVFYFGLAGMDGGLTLAMGLFLRMKILLLGLTGLVVHLREPVKVEMNEAADPEES